jgi:uncharacterized protein YciI
MSKTFAAIVQRTSAWDQSKPVPEQPGFAAHVAYMGGLETEGFIVLSGLMAPSNDVLFIFSANDEAEIRQQMSQDPWQRDGLTRLVRVEEVMIRTWAPSPPGA